METTDQTQGLHDFSEDRIAGFDEFGFAVFKLGSEPDIQRSHNYGSTILQNESLRETLVNEWNKIFQDWQKYSHGNKKAKVDNLVRTGVPVQCRPQLWKCLLDSKALKKACTYSYKAGLVAIREQLIDLGITEYGHGYKILSALSDVESMANEQNMKQGHLDIKCVRQIILDVDRSFPNHELFMGDSPKAKEGRATLFRLLAGYARYNPEVAYCQGMSFIVGLLMMQMDEEDAFWCTVALFERQKYLLGYFDSTLEKIQHHAAVFQKLMKQKLPKLHRHFIRLHVEPLMYVAPWFMSVFTGLPCWDTVLLIWDRLMIEGITSIFAAGLTILKLNKDDLLKTKDLSTLLPKLLHVNPESIEYGNFAPLFWDTIVEKWEIDSLLSVVQEDLASKERQPSKRKRAGEEENIEKEMEIKRQKTEEARDENDGAPSMFRKFVNIFTPLTQRLQMQLENVPNAKADAVKKLKPRLVPGDARQVRKLRKMNSRGRVSPCEVATENSVHFKKLRRSPRIAAQSKLIPGINTPSNRTLVGSNAKVQHSFKMFHTPTPLRKTQQRSRQSSHVLSSPEVELKLIKGALFGPDER